QAGVALNGRLAQPSDFLRDFIVNARGAREVHIVGDFNNWSPCDQTLLWQKEEGIWHKRLFLGPGRYRYKFIVDGEWQVDPYLPVSQPNAFGTVDSYLEFQK
ncbi:MAG TPA: glycogen-binding domain-containing protein, partial [bacterium]|nr:glycogen-binding domain-containing protein [bacterium]